MEIRNYKYNFIDAPVKREGEMISPQDYGASYDFKPPEKNPLNAFNDLMSELQEGEIVEAIVFGEYGWSGFGEDECANPIPKEKIGVVMTLKEAKPLMDGWSFFGGYGSPDCYATNVWTNQRIIWVTQYDGSTTLDSAPRNPKDGAPEMPGG